MRQIAKIASIAKIAKSENQSSPREKTSPLINTDNTGQEKPKTLKYKGHEGTQRKDRTCFALKKHAGEGTSTPESQNRAFQGPLTPAIQMIFSNSAAGGCGPLFISTIELEKP